jgi:opacity protein-like surface antigen
MKRTTIALAGIVAVVVSTGTALALDLSVAGFYSPGFVAGGAAEVREIAAGGFKGRVGVNVADNLELALNLGYNDFVYREARYSVPEVITVLSLPMFITTVGPDYSFQLGPFRPYLGAGGALARESAEAATYKSVDWYGGFYADGGFRYSPAGNWTLEAGPRYTHLFDKPVDAYDGWNLHDFQRSPKRSQLVEFLVGVGYHF